MAETDTFYFHFRWTLLLTFFSGTDIPEIKKILPKRFSRLLFYVPPLIMIFVTSDYILQLILQSDDLDKVMFISLMGLVPICVWSILAMFYFIYCRDDMRDLISMWNQNFQPELWLEFRELALKWQKEKAWRKISLLIKYHLLPYLIFAVMLALKGDFLLPTMFVTGEHEKSPRLVLLMQGISGLSFTVWYTMLHCFFSTFMRLIIVELEYVELCLGKLLSTIEMAGDGTLYSAGKMNVGVELTAHEHTELCHEAEKKLFKLISYHSKILQFAHQVKKVFGPFFFSQVIVPSLMMSQYVYAVITGQLPLQFAALIMVGQINMTILTLFSCSIGEKVNEKSSRCMNAAFYKNWMAYPVGIQKLLIPMINQRPITINPYGLMPMQRETFTSMVLLQYKFFSFIAKTY